MGFRGQSFAFDSPAAAVAGMITTLRARGAEPGAETVPLADARGRILAEDVRADRDSPAFDYSAMDGFAARSRDLTGPAAAPLPVAAESRIGLAPPAMPAGACVVRIATGAALPEGADLIVKREDVEESGADGARAITVLGSARARLRAGDNIRRRAENSRAGDIVLPAGSLLGAGAIGVLAAVGAATPRVFVRPRVLILTTGDELVAPEVTPEPFQLRNSNAAALREILGAARWLDVAPPVHARDERDQLGHAIDGALRERDVLVLSGGVSMGHRDHVRACFEERGAEIIFHGLPQRPGKPMLGAVIARAQRRPLAVFGLPGNPVSAMVTCARVVIPVLRAAAGASAREPERRVTLANSDGRSLELWWHRLVRLCDDGSAELVDGRGSGDLIAGGRADGFIEVPPGEATGAEPSVFWAWPS